MADLSKTFLSPNESNPTKQNSVTRQLLEKASTFPFGARIHLNGTNQTYTPPSPNNYYLLPTPGTAFNQSSLWTSNANTGNAFTPPSGSSLVYMDAQIWVTSGAANPPCTFVAKWVKNASLTGGFQTVATGADVVAGIGGVSALGAGSAVIRASGYDAPRAGDYYNLFIWIDSTTLGTTVVTVDGNIAHTYECFAVLR